MIDHQGMQDRQLNCHSQVPIVGHFECFSRRRRQAESPLTKEHVHAADQALPRALFVMRRMERSGVVDLSMPMKPYSRQPIDSVGPVRKIWTFHLNNL